MYLLKRHRLGHPQSTGRKTIQLGKRTLEAHKQSEPMVEVLQGDIYPGDRVVVKGGHELSSLFFLGVLKLYSSDQQRLGIRSEPASHREVASTTQLTASVTLPPENRSVLSSQLDGNGLFAQTKSGTIRRGR